MVSLTDVESSNARISTVLPPGLVAVFVGGTNGIGETTLKRFAKHARQPRAYFIGRSQEAGDRIAAECKALNPEGEYIFIQEDVSLIRNVDEVCRDIKTRVKTINILFLSIGTLVFGTGMLLLPLYQRAVYMKVESLIIRCAQRLQKAFVPLWLWHIIAALDSS